MDRRSRSTFRGTSRGTLPGCRERHPEGIAKALVVALACAALALACSTASGSGKPHEDAHALRADKLQEVMRGFDEAVRKHVPGQTDVHDRWEGVFPAIAEAAAGLQASAIELSGHPPGKLELPDRGRFSVLGRSLAQAAGELQEAAARGDADAVSLARAQVGSACRDCHARFRPDSAGVNDAFR